MYPTGKLAMPISFQITGGIVWVTLSGNYSLEEIEQASSDIVSDPAYVEGMNALLDARASTVDPSVLEIRQRVLLLRSVAGRDPIRMAIVVSDALRFGLSRMLSTYAQMQDLKMEVFMELEEAREWLESGIK